jgi:hypothetical protein
MRKNALVLALGILAGTAYAIGQTGIATDAGYVPANPLPVHGKLSPITPVDSGPPGADQIRYDDAHPAMQAWYFYDRRTRYAVRMDPAYHPAIVAQCDICVAPEWPFPHHDSIYVQIWFDRNGDGMPDFPAVWGAWAQGRDGSPDTTAITVPVPLGQVICDSGSFWVGVMMDTIHGGLEVVADDSVMNYPDHQVYYWPERDTWCHMDIGGDWMIRSWTYRMPPLHAYIWILAPGGEVRVGDSVTPRVRLMNLGTTPGGGCVWMRIEHTCSTDNYLDSARVYLQSNEIKDTTFRRWAARYPGVYRVQCTADTNDTTWHYFNAESTGVAEYPPQPGLAGRAVEVGPSPIRSAATIRYSVARESRAKLRILDTRGRVVRTLASGCLAPGEHVATWDTRDDQGHPAARGIYFVRLESPDCRETRKVVLTR